MGIDNLGFARCKYCNAEYRVFSISNRHMGGLAKGWKYRHERACLQRTEDERMKWAKKYIGKDRTESSIIIPSDFDGSIKR